MGASGSGNLTSLVLDGAALPRHTPCDSQASLEDKVTSSKSTLIIYKIIQNLLMLPLYPLIVEQLFYLFHFQ